MGNKLVVITIFSKKTSSFSDSSALRLFLSQIIPNLKFFKAMKNKKTPYATFFLNKK